MPQSPETIARAFVNAINAHDVNELAKLMSEKHLFIDSLGTVVQGRRQMRDGWTGYFCMVPDYTVLVEETFSDGPTVVMLGLARGTYSKHGQVSALGQKTCSGRCLHIVRAAVGNEAKRKKAHKDRLKLAKHCVGGRRKTATGKHSFQRRLD